MDAAGDRGRSGATPAGIPERRSWLVEAGRRLFIRDNLGAAQFVLVLPPLCARAQDESPELLPRPPACPQALQGAIEEASGAASVQQQLQRANARAEQAERDLAASTAEQAELAWRLKECQLSADAASEEATDSARRLAAQMAEVGKAKAALAPLEAEVERLRAVVRLELLTEASAVFLHWPAQARLCDSTDAQAMYSTLFALHWPSA